MGCLPAPPAIPVVLGTGPRSPEPQRPARDAVTGGQPAARPPLSPASPSSSARHRLNAADSELSKSQPAGGGAEGPAEPAAEPAAELTGAPASDGDTAEALHSDEGTGQGPVEPRDTGGDAAAAVAPHRDTVEAHQSDEGSAKADHAVETFRRAAAMYRKRSEFPQAIEFFQRVVHKKPRDASAWAWLGYCSLMVDNVEQAFVAYQQAMYLEPPQDEPYVWYGLGLLYERSNCDEEAVQYLSQSLEMGQPFDRQADCAFRCALPHSPRAMGFFLFFLIAHTSGSTP